MLTLDKVFAGYGDIAVLHGVSLHVDEGEIVALIGANGAGKTTLLKTISGLLRAKSGTIQFGENAIQRWRPDQSVAAGLVQVAEGRKLFPQMTVLENLEMGSFIPSARKERTQSLTNVYDLFPRLAERQTQLAGTLSGGEQQMLAIGRSLMTLPKLLMLDEPSLGLAPMLVADIFRIIQQINKQGTTVLIVEQNTVQTLQVANRGYVMENGEIVLAGSGDELLGDERIREAYLGL